MEPKQPNDDADESSAGIAQRFLAEQARRTAEQKAKKDEADRKRETEERERREQERVAEEERRKLRREEDERRRVELEEEEVRRKEEEVLRRAEGQVRAREEARNARELAEAVALRDARAKESAAQMREEIRARARKADPLRAASRTRRVVAVFVLLLVGGLVAINFVPLDPRSFEKAAAAHFGTPVTIGSVRLSTLKVPALQFERVTIGPAGEVQIAAVTVKAGLGTFLDEKKRFKSIELQGAKIPASWLAAAIWEKPRSDTLHLERMIARGVTIQAEGVELPALDVEARLDAGGALQSLQAKTADGTQTLNMSMKGGEAAVELSAKPFRLPFAGMVQLEDLVGNGTLTRSELNLSRFEARALDGSFGGSARLRWGANWGVEGDFVARSMDPARVAAALVSNGRLEGKGTFSMRAATPDKLQHTARLYASFTVHRGTLGFVDLTRLLQGANASGGTTSFSRMDGNASLAGGHVQVRQVRLAAGLLNATGETGIDPHKNLNGRFEVAISSQSRAALSLGGTVAAPQIKPGR